MSFLHRIPATLRNIIIFLIFYGLAILFFSHKSHRDPTSIFFDAKRAYKPSYSTDRVRQAQAFAKTAWLRSKTANQHDEDSIPPICVGIASGRGDSRGLRTTVGSLLQGLSSEERKEVNLKVLIGHVDPSGHIAVGEPWLENTVDEVLFYNSSLSATEIARITELEERSRENDVDKASEKEVLDNTILLKACHASRSEYIAILEENVVAMDGWLHRTLQALEEAEINTIESQRWEDCKFRSR